MPAADGAVTGSVAPAGPAKAIRYGREYLVVLLAAAALYGLTAAPGPLWQDSGVVQLRVLRRDVYGDMGLALSHPLYYTLAIAFQALPLGESAFKTNLVSVLFGAVTVANVFLLLRLLTQSRWAAAIGTASLAVAQTFWQHCALAETYTLASALLTAELLCLAQYARTAAPRWLLLLFLASGLGISNHLLAALNMPVWCILLLWRIAKRRFPLGLLPVATVAWLAGASLYLALVGGALAAGQPWREVVHAALFGTGWSANVLNTRISGGLLLRGLLYLGLNFPTPAALLGLIGLWALRRFRWPAVARSIAALLAIHLLWALHYNIVDQYTFFVPTVVLSAVVIGLGADRFLTARRRAWARWLLIAALLPAVVYLPLPWIARSAGLSLGVAREVPYRDRYSYFLWPWKTGYDGPQRFASQVQQLLPPGAVLVADGTTVPPLHYLMETGRWPKPIAVWPQPHCGETGYWPEPADVEGALRAGRVYVVSPQAGYGPAWLLDECTFEPVGPVYRAVPKSDPGREPR